MSTCTMIIEIIGLSLSGLSYQSGFTQVKDVIIATSRARGKEKRLTPIWGMHIFLPVGGRGSGKMSV